MASSVAQCGVSQYAIQFVVDEDFARQVATILGAAFQDHSFLHVCDVVDLGLGSTDEAILDHCARSDAIWLTMDKQRFRAEMRVGGQRDGKAGIVVYPQPDDPTVAGQARMALDQMEQVVKLIRYERKDGRTPHIVHPYKPGEKPCTYDDYKARLNAKQSKRKKRSGTKRR